MTDQSTGIVLVHPGGYGACTGTDLAAALADDRCPATSGALPAGAHLVHQRANPCWWALWRRERYPWLMACYTTCTGCPVHGLNAFGTWVATALGVARASQSVRGPLLLGMNWGTRRTPRSMTESDPDLAPPLTDLIDSAWSKWRAIQARLPAEWRSPTP